MINTGHGFARIGLAIYLEVGEVKTVMSVQEAEQAIVQLSNEVAAAKQHERGARCQLASCDTL